MSLLPCLLAIPLAALVLVIMAWRHPVLQAAVVLAMSLGSWAVAAALWGESAPTGPYAVGGWPAPYGIVLQADGLSRLMVTLAGTVVSAAALYHLGQTLEGRSPTHNPVYQLTFPLLLLALNGLFITADFFNFYVFFELVAVSSYLLVSMGKHFPLEAAWKYSAQSVLGSICLLVGVSLLYGETGALGMAEVAARLAEPAWWAAPFVLIAFLLKGALFPFHFWQPDAHAAATTAGSVLLAGLLIKVGLYGLFRFWPILMGAELQTLFVGVGAGSIAFGAVAAWRQADAKRLLGYSSISQLGFVLLGLGWGSVGAVAAALFYLISHSLGKTALFLATGALSDRVGNTRFEALSGAGRGHPGLSAAYLLGVLSLAGLPPTVGFVAKVALLREGAFVAAWEMLAWAVVGSLMTLAYALRAYQLLFWVEPAEPAVAAGRPHPASTLALALSAGLIVGLMALAEPLASHCLASAAALRGPSAAGGAP